MKFTKTLVSMILAIAMVLSMSSFAMAEDTIKIGVIGPMTAPAPHSTHEYDVIIADEKGEYVCFSGMWWVPENRLAYMEPLCTIPEYRGVGLASAALSAHVRRLRPLGARRMTGGDNPFYRKIGFDREIRWQYWKKEKTK